MYLSLEVIVSFSEVNFVCKLQGECVGRTPRPPLGLMICWQDSYRVIPTAVIYHNRRRQSKISKGRGTWGEVQGKQVQASKVLSVESHRTHLIPRTIGCDNTWNVYQESLLNTWCPGFLLGADRIGSHCLAHTQISKRKADVQHKPYCSHKQFRHSEPLLSVVVGTLLKSTFLDVSQGPSL